jgi:hypothetical protein
MTPKKIRPPWRRTCHGFAFAVTMLVSVTALATISHSQARASEIAKCARDSIQASAEFVASATDEASRRFHIPPQWIRTVMRAESYGDACAVSGKGAIGLMQIMPATYEELRLKHALGPDPFNPGDNLLAGAAYLSEMFERYGEGGFLAAYNAGPQRYEQYLHGRPLPTETINYVSGLASKLGLERLSPAQVSGWADVDPASIFVDLAEPRPSGEVAKDDISDGESNRRKAVSHPLFPAQRVDNIFARVSLSDGGSIARLRVVQHSPADIFVARRAR